MYRQVGKDGDILNFSAHCIWDLNKEQLLTAVKEFIRLWRLFVGENW